MADLITSEYKDGIFVITMDHPKANAITLEMVGLLQGAFKEASRQKQVRVVVFRGQAISSAPGRMYMKSYKPKASHTGSTCSKPIIPSFFRSGNWIDPFWLKLTAPWPERR